jgi:hypothetical protein
LFLVLLPYMYSIIAYGGSIAVLILPRLDSCKGTD